MVSFTLKAGQTFALGFRVTNLDPAATWAAACEVRDPEAGTLVGMMIATLTPDPASTTGELILSLVAAPAETEKWLRPCDVERLLVSDIKFTSGSAVPDVVLSSTFSLTTLRRVTQ